MRGGAGVKKGGAHGVELKLAAGFGWWRGLAPKQQEMTSPLQRPSQQRKRHYWRLDCKCITLFQNNTTNRYYKVGLPLQLPQTFPPCPPASLFLSQLLQPDAHESHPLPTHCLPTYSPSAGATQPACVIPAVPFRLRDPG